MSWAEKLHGIIASRVREGGREARGRNREVEPTNAAKTSPSKISK